MQQLFTDGHMEWWGASDKSRQAAAPATATAVLVAMSLPSASAVTEEISLHPRTRLSPSMPAEPPGTACASIHCSFDGVDIALFSAGGSISKKFGPIASAKGCTVSGSGN